MYMYIYACMTNTYMYIYTYIDIRPRGSQGRAQGIPGIPWVSGDIAGSPGIFFIKINLYYNSITSFHNMIL